MQASMQRSIQTCMDKSHARLYAHSRKGFVYKLPTQLSLQTSHVNFHKNFHANLRTNVLLKLPYNCRYNFHTSVCEHCCTNSNPSSMQACSQDSPHISNTNFYTSFDENVYTKFYLLLVIIYDFFILYNLQFTTTLFLLLVVTYYLLVVFYLQAVFI